jgi:predicted ATP-grasp superfamily ATP-dependent carboligase
MKKQNILLLDADGTQGLILAETLYKAGYILHFFCYEKYSYGFHSRYVKHKVIAPSAKQNEYLKFLIEYIQQNKIDVLLPMSDDTAKIISKYKSDLLKIVKFIIPNYDVFIKGYNKGSLMTVCERNNFPHPQTIKLSQDNINNIDNKIFPALIKPNITCGARGLTLVNSMEEFELNYPKVKAQYGKCTLQEFIQPGGTQVKVQLLVGENNELLFSSVIYKYRWYPEKAGSSCCAVSIRNDEIVDICYNLMKSLGWQGFADFDTIEDPKDGKLKIMELNPRVPACVKASIKSGIDWGTIIVDESLGNKHKTYNYTVGKKLRHIGFDILWFYYSKNRFKTKPNWFKFIDKNLSFQDFCWKDPLPFIFGTLGNIKQQLNPEFRKSKSGLRK